MVAHASHPPPCTGVQGSVGIFSSSLGSLVTLAFVDTDANASRPSFVHDLQAWFLLRSVSCSACLSSALFFPPRILKELQKIQRHYLWRKNKQESGPSLASWELTCRPKNKGGLGILNLWIQNVALLMKHVNKFVNRADTQWV